MPLDDVSKTDYCKRMTGFTKLFSGLVHSTVWREEMHVKVVWITMLAMADRNGFVAASLPGLADASRVTMEQCVDALQRLSDPDPYSRTKAHEGRRIEASEGGWTLLNYLKYRELQSKDERRIANREHVREHRARKQMSSSVSRSKRSKHIAEAEAKAEADAGKPADAPRQSWLAPFVEAYREALGEPPIGEMARALKPINDALGDKQAFDIFRHWLVSPDVKYGVSKFGQRWKQYLAGPPRNGKPTQQDRNFAVLQSALETPDGD